MKIFSKKRTIALGLAFSICMVSSAFSTATSPNKRYKSGKEFDISLNYNKGITLNTDVNKRDLKVKFKKDLGSIKSNDTLIDLKLKNLKNISIDEDIPFEAEGKMIIGGSEYAICPKGNLLATLSSDGKIVLVGALSGYLNNVEADENWCIMSVNYSPDDNQCLISASIGVLTDTTIPVDVGFGSKFTNIEKASKKKIDKMKAESNSDSEINTSSKTSSLMSGGTGSPAPDDPILQTCTSTCGASFFTSIYLQQKTHPQLNNQVMARVSVNFDKARDYIKKKVDSKINSACISDTARMKIVSDNGSYYVNDHYPKEDAKTIELPIIPIYLGPFLIDLLIKPCPPFIYYLSPARIVIG